MSVMDRFLNAMKLEGDDGGYYDGDDDGYYDSPSESTPRKTVSFSGRDEASPAPEKQAPAAPRTMPVTKSRRSTTSSGMEVCVIKPTSVEDGREITETLLGNRTVVLNLEGLDVDIAQRIIDFTSGSCFAISGNLQKISRYIFIITPPSVDISGDFQDILHGMSGAGPDGPLQM